MLRREGIHDTACNFEKTWRRFARHRRIPPQRSPQATHRGETYDSDLAMPPDALPCGITMDSLSIHRRTGRNLFL